MKYVQGLFVVVSGWLFVAGTVVVPSAGAASVSLNGTQMVVQAGLTEALDVSARPLDAGTFEVDLGSATGWSAPGSCTQDLSAIVCPAAAITTLRVIGGSEDDRVSVRGSVVLDADGNGGDDALRGGDAADQLDGGDGSDDLNGRGGSDSLTGGGAADVLVGADGDDQLDGDAGEDVLDGGIGDDHVSGGSGSDVLTGGDGADTLSGAAGDDQLEGGEGDDQFDGGDGDDVAFGGTGDDHGTGGPGADQLDGAAGADVIDGGSGADVLAGGSGSDLLRGGTEDDQLDGGDDADQLLGGDDRDRLAGGDGDDSLDGQAGEDALDGGSGTDLVFGGADADTLAGKLDGDRFAGGDGRDTVSYADAAVPLTVDVPGAFATGPGPARDTFLDAPEVVIGGPQGDVLHGSQVSGTALFGGDGDDVLSGGPYADTLGGGDGRDTADYSARLDGVAIHANDLAESGAGGERDTVASSIEVLVGGRGPDDLVGAEGASELIGGAGDDHLEDLLDGAPDVLRCGDGTDTAVADRTDQVAQDCERWNNGAYLVRTVDPISAAIRTERLIIDRGGRTHVSMVCGSEAVGSCRALLTVQLRHGRKWRPGASRSVLLTPGRRRNVAVFTQRGFRALAARMGHHPQARIHLEVRDAIGRTATAERDVPVTLPAATGAAR